MGEDEFQRITALLERASAAFEVVEHAAVRTNEEAAAATGRPLAGRVKALLVKFKRKGQSFFALFAVPADKRLDFKKAQAILQASEVRFASLAEVVEQTGCEPGGVPPFGHPHPLAVLVDATLYQQPTLELNAGLTTRTIRLANTELRKAFDAAGVATVNVIE